MSASRRLAAGFTMTELMVVVALTAILAMLAAPSFTQIIEGQRARSAATDLYIAMNRARSEAIKRNTQVSLTPKSGGDWASGWKVPDPADPSSNPLLEEHESLNKLTATGPASVVYMSSGRVQGNTAPSIQINGSYATTVRCVTALLSGEPQLKSGSC